MKDYAGLAIQFVEELKKNKNSDGSKIYDQESISYRTLFKYYLPFAIKHGLGSSDSAFRKGLFAVMEALGFVTRRGEEIRFGRTNFEEYKKEVERK